MNKKNGSILSAVIFSSGVFLGYILPKETSSPSNFVNTDYINQLEAKLNIANQEIRELKKMASRSSLPENILVSNHERSSFASSTQNANSDITKLQEFEAKLLTRRAQEFNKWMVDELTKSPSFSVGDAMQKKFDAEPVEANWAQQQQNNWSDAFSKKPELAGIALIDTKCHSTTCQLSIGFTDIEQANKIAQQISQSVAAEGKYSSIIASPDQQKGITTLYISNEEEGLKLN